MVLQGVLVADQQVWSVAAMVRELDTVLEDLPAVLKHLPEYIAQEEDVNRRMKAQLLLDALSKDLFNLSAAFFCDVFTIVCAVSKMFETEKGVRLSNKRVCERGLRPI